MSITPEDFLAEAQQAAKRTDEMGRRQAISRAYYAAYHWALTVSHHCPTPPPTSEGVHRRLIRRFQKVPNRGFQGAKIAQAIGSWLDKGRLLRQEADYELKATMKENQPALAISWAKKVKGLVDEFAALHTP